MQSFTLACMVAAKTPKISSLKWLKVYTTESYYDNTLLQSDLTQSLLQRQLDDYGHLKRITEAVRCQVVH